MKKELVGKIRQKFGLNLYEAKAWLALLAKGSASIAEVNELSKVPRSRVYDVLKTLEVKGFCIAKMGKPIKYLAVKPEIVVERLKKNIQSSTEERLKTLEKVKGTGEYEELDKLFKAHLEPTETIGSVIRGKNALQTQIISMITDARKRVVLVSDADEIEKRLGMLGKVLEKKARNGVSVKLGVTNGSKADFKTELRVKSLPVNAKFCIVDSSVLLVTEPESGEDVAIWVKSDYFANSLAKLAGF